MTYASSTHLDLNPTLTFEVCFNQLLCSSGGRGVDHKWNFVIDYIIQNLAEMGWYTFELKGVTWAHRVQLGL